MALLEVDSKRASCIIRRRLEVFVSVVSKRDQPQYDTDGGNRIEEDKDQVC